MPKHLPLFMLMAQWARFLSPLHHWKADVTQLNPETLLWVKSKVDENTPITFLWSLQEAGQ